MAAHATQDDIPESTVGVALLPIFALAIIGAVLAIGFLIAYPGVLMLMVAMTAVLGLTFGIVVLLGRLIGPERH